MHEDPQSFRDKSEFTIIIGCVEKPLQNEWMLANGYGAKFSQTSPPVRVAASTSSLAS